MLKNLYRRDAGQSLMEYTIVLGVVVAVLFTMGPMLQRGSQGLIKVVADQIGVQENADQIFEKSTGQLDSSMQVTRAVLDKQILYTYGLGSSFINYAYGDQTTLTINTVTNLGFVETD